ncbi:MAG TPA: cell envelope integrity protein CreD [Thermohalobaculum sp.]|nr:cell envelope integrity protein CreD [Thermohalobaculum sp.]
MSPVIIDLAAKKGGTASFEALVHPAGVKLPFDGPADAAQIIPEIRSDIRSGAYSADIIGLLPDATEEGDRVLVIGAGLGVVSTLVALSEGIERVIAIEANTALIPYLLRVHELNNVDEIETVNAVLADGKKGRVPFFARRDLRTSSLLPHDRSWQQVMMVPFMDVNLILAEEQISLIVCDIPVVSAQLLAVAGLDSVERILVNCSDDSTQCWEEDGICALLIARGYVPEPSGSAVLFRRTSPRGSALRSVVAIGQGGGSLATGSGEDQPEIFESSEDTDEDDGGDDFAAEGDGEDASVLVGAAGPNLGELNRDMTEPARLSGEGQERHEHEPAPSEAKSQTDVQADTSLPVGRSVRPTDGRGGHLLGLIMLALILALPLILFSKIATDRAVDRSEVEWQIGASWGGAQTLTGPFLVIPVEATRMVEFQRTDGTLGVRPEISLVAPLVLLPETLEINSEVNTEMRNFGGFTTPVYNSRHVINLDFDTTRVSGTRLDELLIEGEAVLWEQAELGVGITEPRALRGGLTLNGSTGPIGFESGINVSDLTGIHARTGDPRMNTGGWRFTLDLNGSQQFRVTPAGRATEARMHSDWAHPKFAGAFLPTESQIGETGFVAEWSVPQLAHSLPQAFRGTKLLGDLGGANFGVDLAPAADLYDGARRAAKFGFLLIILTFGAIFVMEKSASRPPHIMQYALIGVAQCLFFTLFLPLAEQVGMGSAYALATVVTIVVVTGYAWLGIGLAERSLWLAAALGMLYGLMYLVLTTEENMLLMSAILAFLAVAVAMWGTRNENWDTALGGMFSTSPPDQATTPKTS